MKTSFFSKKQPIALVSILKGGLSAVLCLVLSAVSGQTNTFPISGNVGIGVSNPSEKLEISNGFVKIGNVSLGGTELSSARNHVSFGGDRHASLLIGSNIYLNSMPSDPAGTKLELFFG